MIDPSVLTAFGEIATFAGSLIGIDYTYKYKSMRFDRGMEHNFRHYNEENENVDGNNES